MKLIDYIKETKAEMSHVVWPTRRQAIVFTVVVVIFSIGIAMYLGLFDYLFSLALRQII
jgi:preprotein translocase SecE subunit